MYVHIVLVYIYTAVVYVYIYSCVSIYGISGIHRSYTSVKCSGIGTSARKGPFKIRQNYRSLLQNIFSFIGLFCTVVIQVSNVVGSEQVREKALSKLDQIIGLFCRISSLL